MNISEKYYQLTEEERRKSDMEKGILMSKIGEHLFQEGLLSLQEKQKFDDILNHR